MKLSDRIINESADVQNLCLTGEMVSQAALMRKESRGQHRRKDFPQRNDKEWLKWIVLSKVNGEMNLKSLRVPVEKYKVKPPQLT